MVAGLSTTITEMRIGMGTPLSNANRAGKRQLGLIAQGHVQSNISIPRTSGIK